MACVATHATRGEKVFMGKANYTFIDHDSEGSSVSLSIPDLNATNINTILTAVTTLQTALENVTLGTLRQIQVIGQTDVFSGVAPADGNAQRETKWLVQGVDSSGFGVSMEIPTAMLSLLPTGSGILDLSAGAGLALKQALDAIWLSRHGDPVTVSRVIHVGRNI